MWLRLGLDWIWHRRLNFIWINKVWYGAVHKRRPHKTQKIESSPLVRKMSALLAKLALIYDVFPMNLKFQQILNFSNPEKVLFLLIFFI